VTGLRGDGIVRIFEREPDLLAHLPAEHAAMARDRTVVEYVTMPKGPVTPPALGADAFDLGFLVLEGLLLRRVEFVGRRAVEVLGPGDVIRPWRPEKHSPSIPSKAGWKVCEPAQIALLDRRFEQDVARWPGVISSLLDRLDARSTSLAIQLALAQVPRLEARLLCLLWHLADKFGRVEAGGVSVRLRLSQETLADLTSSRRPSVSAALRGLRERGLVLTPSPGRWLLTGAPPAEMAGLTGELIQGDPPD
jgi:CRP/FNR family transcriptional regulator, cyclic AMP receptor protein